MINAVETSTSLYNLYLFNSNLVYARCLDSTQLIIPLGRPTQTRVQFMMTLKQSSFPALSDRPHHLMPGFEFPKRLFGKAKQVLCSGQSQWFDTWPFLHYDEGQDVVFCHTCVTTFKLGRMKSSNNASSALVRSEVKSF